MKFVMLVEGDMEWRALPEFLKRWIDPRLTRPATIKADRSRGWPKLLSDIPRKAPFYLAQNDTIAVIGLIDLYGPQYPIERATLPQRLAWLRIKASFSNPRFRMHAAVHETEAWLLSDSSVFPRNVRQRIDKLAQGGPEAVNFNRPPSVRLKELYPQELDRDYEKVTDGTDLMRKLAPEKAAAACPHLKMLLDDMLELARNAGLAT